MLQAIITAIIIIILFLFIISRLIGVTVSKAKITLALFLSFSITGAVYWYLYLQNSPKSMNRLSPSFWAYTFFVMITTLFILLIFEMLSNQSKVRTTFAQRVSDGKIKLWFLRQRRYVQVILIVIKKGVLNKSGNRAASLRKTLEECG